MGSAILKVSWNFQGSQIGGMNIFTENFLKEVATRLSLEATFYFQNLNEMSSYKRIFPNFLVFL